MKRRRRQLYSVDGYRNVRGVREPFCIVVDALSHIGAILEFHRKGGDKPTHTRIVEGPIRRRRLRHTP